MADDTLRIMVIGAHPDDPDVSAGGTVALYTRAGHQVQMVSLTNGDAGHMEIGGAPLAWRRRLEAQAAGRTLGAAYLVLDHHDGELVPDLDLRREVIRLIRSFGPDLVLAPRPWDYHPDHRAAGQVVQDASYLLTVPNAVSDTPHLERMPVIAHLWDRFQTPCPFRADIAVDIDPTLEDKVDALACHESQMFEWLPYNRGELDRVPADAAARREWLREHLLPRFARPADTSRDLLMARYGPERGERVACAEAFQVSEYGRQPSTEELEALFPF
jgi:LmbE family N-acetylglucosaminyl deacetylase